jgi:hypothetical protein
MTQVITPKAHKTTDRALRAYREASSYVCERSDRNPRVWRVENIRTGKTYAVDTVAGVCTCPDYQERGRHSGTACKHLHLVRQTLFFEAAAAAPEVKAPVAAPDADRLRRARELADRLAAKRLQDWGDLD